jgi:hypothetical protein
MGRIGYCRSGHAAGSYILLHLGTATRDPEDAQWQGFFRPPLDRQVGTEEWSDHVSGFFQNLIEECRVEWAPAGVDAEAERRLFDFRRSWMQPSIGEITNEPEPRRRSEIFGRAATLQAMGEMVQGIRESRGLTRENVAADDIISARRILSDDVAEFEAGSLTDLEKIIYILQALDYSLAIVPLRGAIKRDWDDPWAEFR